MTDLYNLSLAGSKMRAVWKLAATVTILKASKPHSKSTCYRPISLLSPLVNVFERLLLPYLADTLPLDEFYHGLGPSRFTTSAILLLAHKIVAVFNQRNPPSLSLTFAVVFSKALDTAHHRS